MKTYVNLSMMQNDHRLRCNFTEEAIEELYNYYEILEDESRTEIEYDPVAIRCDWGEYTHPYEACDYYGMTWNEIIESTVVLFIEDGGVLVLHF